MIEKTKKTEAVAPTDQEKLGSDIQNQPKNSPSSASVTDKDTPKSSASTESKSVFETVNAKTAAILTTLTVLWALITGGLEQWRLYIKQQEDSLRLVEVARMEQNKAIADFSRFLSQLRFNCDEALGPLSLIETTENQRAENCREAFTNATDSFYATSIVLTQPDTVTDEVWSSHWMDLEDAISDIAFRKYVSTAIDCSWNKIVNLKQRKLAVANCEQ